jgi:hypothetical protein
MSSLRSRTKATAKAKPPRSWAITLIKNRGVLLGYVEVPDEKAAELVAAKAFMLSEWQRKRLLVRGQLPFRRAQFFLEGGAMKFIEKSAIITGEYWVRVY